MPILLPAAIVWCDVRVWVLIQLLKHVLFGLEGFWMHAARCFESAGLLDVLLMLVNSRGVLVLTYA